MISVTLFYWLDYITYGNRLVLLYLAVLTLLLIWLDP